jgi:hypothetical protein
MNTYDDYIRILDALGSVSVGKKKRKAALEALFRVAMNGKHLNFDEEAEFESQFLRACNKLGLMDDVVETLTTKP